MLEKEIKVEFFKSSGPGGMRRDAKQTAVRLTHLPTGISVIADEFRSQSKNKELAFKRLNQKLMQLSNRKKIRIPTQIPLYVKKRRIEQKRKHSEKKKLRKISNIDYGDFT